MIGKLLSAFKDHPQSEWTRGFDCGVSKLSAQLDQAETEADTWERRCKASWEDEKSLRSIYMDQIDQTIKAEQERDTLSTQLRELLLAVNVALDLTPLDSPNTSPSVIALQATANHIEQALNEGGQDDRASEGQTGERQATRISLADDPAPAPPSLSVCPECPKCGYVNKDEIQWLDCSMCGADLPTCTDELQTNSKQVQESGVADERKEGDASARPVFDRTQNAAPEPVHVAEARGDLRKYASSSRDPLHSRASQKPSRRTVKRIQDRKIVEEFMPSRAWDSAEQAQAFIGGSRVSQEPWTCQCGEINVDPKFGDCAFCGRERPSLQDREPGWKGWQDAYNLLLKHTRGLQSQVESLTAEKQAALDGFDDRTRQLKEAQAENTRLKDLLRKALPEVRHRADYWDSQDLHDLCATIDTELGDTNG